MCVCCSLEGVEKFSEPGREMVIEVRGWLWVRRETGRGKEEGEVEKGGSGGEGACRLVESEVRGAREGVLESRRWVIEGWRGGERDEAERGRRQRWLVLGGRNE